MGMWGQLIGAGMDTAGKIGQGKQDAATAETNRRLSEAQANDALLRGTKDETRYRRQIAMIAGQQKAEFGARNVTVDGTALDILGDTAQIGEEDALTIRNNAAREAWGYRNQANEASRWGANQQSNAYASGIGSLLTSGAQAYGDFRSGGGSLSQSWKNATRDRSLDPVKVSAKRI